MTRLLFVLTLMLAPQSAPPATPDFKKLEGRSDIIVIAEVKEVEPTSVLQPWSGGLVSSYQYVKYSVRSVLKGESPGDEVRVAFLLVRSSVMADKSRPQLSSELFKQGSLQILFLKHNRKLTPPDGEPQAPPTYTGAQQDYGAIPATPEAEAAVRALLPTP